MAANVRAIVGRGTGAPDRTATAPAAPGPAAAAVSGGTLLVVVIRGTPVR
jgi:hypothetical protein